MRQGTILHAKNCYTNIFLCSICVAFALNCVANCTATPDKLFPDTLNHNTYISANLLPIMLMLSSHSSAFDLLPFEQFDENKFWNTWHYFIFDWLKYMIRQAISLVWSHWPPPYMQFYYQDVCRSITRLHMPSFYCLPPPLCLSPPIIYATPGREVKLKVKRALDVSCGNFSECGLFRDVFI